MTSTNDTETMCSFVKFFGGAASGSFLVLLPLLYSEIGSWHEITGVQLGVVVFMVLSCGLLSVKLGSQFIDAVMAGFGHSGF